MNVLVLNCGSSSLKFQLIWVDWETIQNDQEVMLAKGVVERIGSQCLVTLKAQGQKAVKKATPFRDHRQAIDYILKWIISEKSGISAVQSYEDIHAIGHRVVHGGETFQSSVVVNEQVIEGIEDCIELAPLHNPANLSGIAAIEKVLGKRVPQVAVFDTAFHSTMPETSYLYAIPYQFYRRHKIRRYGFHGTSHRYIAYRYRQIKGIEKEQTNIITLHLGNGCSACAIKGGQSLATSMGMTPLQGLTMGTRAGDIDPTILEFLHHKEGMSYENLFSMLNKQSGLLGISGLTHDMRELIDEQNDHADRRANLAIDVFCEQVKKYIGSYLSLMNGADAIVFSGGIGENSSAVRKRVLDQLSFFGIQLDDDLNRKMVGGNEGLISNGGSLDVMVIPTNEELLIARDTFRAIEGDA